MAGASSSLLADLLLAYVRSDVRVALYAEIGLNERKIEQRDTFGERLQRAKKGSFVLHKYNKNEDEYRDWQLPGGTAIAIDDILKCQKPGTEGQGGDEENLGRWTWIRIRGRNNVFTRFVSAYRPCENKNGIRTVWTQHINHFRDRGYPEPNPIELFDQHLTKKIQQ